MPKFSVTVEKKLYCSGTVEVTAKNATAAQDKIDTRIRTGKLQTTSIDWNEPEYEDGSFRTTGDIN